MACLWFLPEVLEIDRQRRQNGKRSGTGGHHGKYRYRLETLIWRVVVLGVVPKNLICRSRYGVTGNTRADLRVRWGRRLHCALFRFVQARERNYFRGRKRPIITAHFEPISV